jgi:hypothetical protein
LISLAMIRCTDPVGAAQSFSEFDLGSVLDLNSSRKIALIATVTPLDRGSHRIGRMRGAPSEIRKPILDHCCGMSSERAFPGFSSNRGIPIQSTDLRSCLQITAAPLAVAAGDHSPTACQGRPCPTRRRLLKWPHLPSCRCTRASQPLDQSRYSGWGCLDRRG